MKILESGENYLETIFLLSEEKGFVRAIDVASRMGFAKPSVSRALGILKKAGYLVIDESSGGLRLTEEGLLRAKAVYERHGIITKLLEKLGVSAKTAEEDACRVEHVISEETFVALKKFLGDL